MRGLRTIDLCGGKRVTDAGIRHLKEIPLQCLMLRETAVTDSALDELSKQTHLKVLAISGTLVTDAGLGHLARLPELRELYIARAHVTDVGIADLKKALPELTVYK
jgi:hypothetical protein